MFYWHLSYKVKPDGKAVIFDLLSDEGRIRHNNRFSLNENSLISLYILNLQIIRVTKGQTVHSILWLFPAHLRLIEVIVNLNYFFASIVSVHDWHIKIKEYDIKMLRLFIVSSLIILVKLIKLKHILLDLFYSQIAIFGGENISFILTIDNLLHAVKLEWFIVYQKNFGLFH